MKLCQIQTRWNSRRRDQRLFWKRCDPFPTISFRICPNDLHVMLSVTKINPFGVWGAHCKDVHQGLFVLRNPQAALCLLLPCAELCLGCLWRRKVLSRTDNPSRRPGRSRNAARCASRALFEDHSPTVGAVTEREKQICGVLHQE